MSATLERTVNAWETHPGWGISVDLTPREILGARQLRVHKRLIGLGLILVAVVCTGVTLMALDSRSAAKSDYEAEQARTATLSAEAAKYDEITMLSTVSTSVAGQLATLMANDVDFVHLMALIRTGLTPHLALTNETIQVTPVVPATPVAAADGTDTGEASDTATTTAPVVPAGPQVIGTISLAGTGSQIKDLAPFIAVLNHLPGVVDVVPTSTSQSPTGTAFTLSMNVTDELYTHAFDLAGVK
jgi:type IV pilus assembly protein PilN